MDEYDEIVFETQDAATDTNPLLSQHHHLLDHMEEELHALQVQHLLPDGHGCG